MARKELNPADAHRRAAKAAERKKVMKQRKERKDARANADPELLQAELERLRELNELRDSAGGKGKMNRKR
jgi:hypothetical protein